MYQSYSHNCGYQGNVTGTDKTQGKSEYNKRKHIDLVVLLILLIFLYENTTNTVELQWLEHLWDHGKLFVTWIVLATELNMVPGQDVNGDDLKKSL